MLTTNSILELLKQHIEIAKTAYEAEQALFNRMTGANSALFENVFVRVNRSEEKVMALNILKDAIWSMACEQGCIQQTLKRYPDVTLPMSQAEDFAKQVIGKITCDDGLIGYRILDTRIVPDVDATDKGVVVALCEPISDQMNAVRPGPAEVK